MDREKVISTLEEIKTQTAEIGLDSAVIAHGFIDKIIALLEEQEETINELQNAYGYLQKQFFEAQDKLLKEQEAIEPNPVYNSQRWFACGKCDCSITREDRFCPRCGQAVKWE